MGKTIALPERAAHLLCRAKAGKGALDGHLIIESALGWMTWETRGEKGRRDIAPLYAAGLVEEFHSPWSPPLVLTADGVEARKQYRKELGYDD